MLMNGDKLLTDQKEVADYAAQYSKSLFSSNLSVLQDLTKVDENIPTLVDDYEILGRTLHARVVSMLN